ncbi:hypothetical protein HK102_004754 [Quaeritorhiza haematococci]|nr:hypothetical protein HK102_004754 [Quaeritorhiza haematococci]
MASTTVAAVTNKHDPPFTPSEENEKDTTSKSLRQQELLAFVRACLLAQQRHQHYQYQQHRGQRPPYGLESSTVQDENSNEHSPSGSTMQLHSQGVYSPQGQQQGQRNELGGLGLRGTEVNEMSVGEGAGGANQLSKADALLSMERLDENFHRYAFVRRVQKRVESVMAPILDSELRKLEKTVDKIMSSPEYTHLVTAITQEVEKTIASLKPPQPKDELQLTPKPSATVAKSLLSTLTTSAPQISLDPTATMSATVANAAENRTTPFTATSPMPLHYGQNINNGHRVLRSDNSFSTMSNVTNERFDEVKAIVSSLSIRNSADVRLAAIQKLASFPSTDILCVDLWPECKVALESSLSDNDASLQVYARVFRSAPPPLMGEIYVSLASHLIQCFETGVVSKMSQRTICGKQFRLLNHFQHEMPGSWCRLPEQIFKDVINSTFRLLNASRRKAPSTSTSTSSSDTISSTNNSKHDTISALQCLSLIDPLATWLEKWMISNMARIHAIPSIVKTDLVRTLVVDILEYSTRIFGEAARASDTVSAATAPTESTDLSPSGANTSVPKSPNDSPKILNDVVVLDVEFDNEDLDDITERLAEHPDSNGTNTHSTASSSRPRWIYRSDCEYLSFLHGLVVVTKMCQYSVGRKCFPIRMLGYSVAAKEVAEDVGGRCPCESIVRKVVSKTVDWNRVNNSLPSAL